MDRESYDVSVRVSGDGRPVIDIDFGNSAASVSQRLADSDGSTLPAEDVDVTYRETDGERDGVLALADRLTGEFVLESHLESDRLSALVEAVLDAEGEDLGEYELRLSGDDGETVTYEKETLLVYDDEGNLLRSRSLIPGGVEL